MLRLERLELQLGGFRLAADLEVPRGATVALMGPSGGGKSTLLSAIAGFLDPVWGLVLWDGHDLGPLPPGQRPVSVLFQDNNLFPHLSALQNVTLGIRPSLRPTPQERARAEAALRTSEERLRNALQIDTVGVLFWSPEFRLREVNQAFLAMTGFSHEEALNLTWQELTPPEFHPASERAVAQIEATGQAAPYEKQYFRKDGSRWWGLFAPRRLSDGEVVEFVLDVSDRIEKEQALTASEQRFRLMADAVPQIVWITDPEGRLEFFNKHWPIM